jgi:hypothetical protein
MAAVLFLLCSINTANTFSAFDTTKMATPQQNDEAFEVKLNRTNLAIIQAVLTSTNAPLDIDWQKAMEKVEVTRADNA